MGEGVCVEGGREGGRNESEVEIFKFLFGFYVMLQYVFLTLFQNHIATQTKMVK